MYHASMEVIEVKQLRDDIMWFFMLPKTIIFFSISIVLILLTIVGTIYDVKMHNIEKNLVAGYNNGTNLNGKASTNKV
ncbi:hypothetical protein NQ318_013697 [Aromia moschata]|uniref:NADH dehydrogenase subunit 6 n=1 Tax=Aromia moschata TaxID=1265417 RepID=A0AAV8ZAM8_9CUCU|nr:hypothetical protein NQ318_013697 [Aromia moschata]